MSVERNVLESFDLIDTVNKDAELYLLCRNAGQEPRGLDAEQVDELARAFDLLPSSEPDGSGRAFSRLPHRRRRTRYG